MSESHYDALRSAKKTLLKLEGLTVEDYATVAAFAQANALVSIAESLKAMAAILAPLAPVMDKIVEAIQEGVDDA
jgi:oligoendopeptidase F